MKADKKFKALAAIAILGSTFTSANVSAECRTYSGTIASGGSGIVPATPTTVCDMGSDWGWGFDFYDSSQWDDWYDDYDYDDEGRSSNIKSEECAGNPILIGSGAKVEYENDFIGTEPDPLKISRKYHSQNEHDGAFGKGWHTNFNKRIEFPEEGFPKLFDEEGKTIKIYSGFHDIPGIGQMSSYVTASGRNYLYQLSAPAGPWVFKHQNNYTEIYSHQGQLLQTLKTSETDPVKMIGKGTRYIWSNDKIVSVIHPSNRKLTMQWLGNHITKVTDHAGNDYTYQYNSNGILTNVSFPDGNSTQYHYEDSRFVFGLTGVSKNNLRFSWFTYDAERRGLTSQHSSGVDKHTFNYSSRSTTVTNPLGHKSTYLYHSSNKVDLKRVTHEGTPYCAAASKRRYWVRELGDVLVESDWNGNETEQKYKSGKLIQKTFAANTPDSQTETYKWHPDTNLISEKNINNVIYKYDYDGRLNLTRQLVFSDGKTKQMDYDYQYHDDYLVKKLSITLPNGGTSHQEFDSSGNLIKDIDISGDVTIYSNYNALGYARKVTLPDGIVINYQFDERGRILKEENVSASNQVTSTSYIYNRFGKVASLTRSDGVEVTYVYDGAGRLITEKQNSGDASESIEKKYTYDLMGNITTIVTGRRVWSTPVNCESETSAVDEKTLFKSSYSTYGTLPPTDFPGPPPECEGSYVFSPTHKVKFEYDQMGHLVKTKDAYNNTLVTYTYDANGNRLTETDASGAKTRFEYDALNRIIKQTDAKGAITEFRYDGRKIDNIKDARTNITSYSQNDLLLTEELSSPDSGLSQVDYDNVGQVDRVVDARGINITNNYDLAGRLRSQSNGNTFNYGISGYAKGKLTSHSNSSESTTYSYNSWGLPSRQQNLINRRLFTLDWGYSDQKQLTSITYPGGNKVNYQYNQHGEVSGITASINGQTKVVMSNISRLPFGPISVQSYGNGVIRTITYDDNYRVKKIYSQGIQSLSYTYDDKHNISSIINGVNGDSSRNYGYDSKNQLTSIRSSAGLGNLFYTYDALGNRIQTTGVLNEVYTIDPNSNRLNKITKGNQTRNLSYDANGNVISDKGFNGSTRTYSYNQDNRMILAGNTVYKYNALGQRIYKKDGLQEHYFIYGHTGQLLAEGSEKQYIYLEGQIVAYISANQLYFVHNDHLGRPEVLTNQYKRPVWRAELTAFNRTVEFSEIGDFNIGFPGQYFDSESGLWYNINRYYDPETGRYTQSDPIGLAGGMNTYAYVGGNPLTKVDPLGLSSKVIGGTCLAGLAGSQILSANTIGAWQQSNDFLSDSIDRLETKFSEHMADGAKQCDGGEDHADVQSSLMKAKMQLNKNNQVLVGPVGYATGVGLGVMCTGLMLIPMI